MTNLCTLDKEDFVECPQSKDLFASNSLFRPEKARAAATHPDTWTEIAARAAAEVAEQTNDVFSVDPPSALLVPNLIAHSLGICIQGQ